MHILKTSILSAALALACATQAQALELGRSAGDLIPAHLAQGKSHITPAPAGSSETQAVHFAWALDAEAPLSATQPYRAESREFWTQLDTAQLKAGWSFTPVAEGALVRISFKDAGKSARIGRDQLQLRVNGKTVEASRAIKHLAGDEELKATGANFSEGTLVFQLEEGMAGQRIDLAVPKAASAALVHVLEPQSNLVMALRADRLQAMPGERITLDASFLAEDKALRAGRVAGLVTAPDGRSFDLDFQIDKSGRASASFNVPADVMGGMEPWEIHAFGATTQGKQQVLRDARTAVMIAIPTARLSGHADIQRNTEGVVISLPVETAAEGRYEVRGTLYGTDSNGELKPMAISHGAQYLGEGQGTLELRFPQDVLNSALSAPYSLRDLNLTDQTRLSLNERRSHALDITAF